MKSRLPGMLLLVPLIFLTPACFNVFSPFSPSVPAALTGLDELLALGEQSMASSSPSNYQTALVAFQRAADLFPGSYQAVSGMCTAYLFSQIAPSVFYSLVQSGDLSLVDGGWTTLKNVSDFISFRLSGLLWKNGRLINTNQSYLLADFYFYESLSAALSVMDQDGDSNILQDAGDLYTFSNLTLMPVSIVSRLHRLSNDFGPVLSLLSGLGQRSVLLYSRLSQAQTALDAALSNTPNAATRTAISNYSGSISGIRAGITSIVSQLGLTGGSATNLSFSTLSVLAGLSFAGDTNYQTVLTNCLRNSGISSLNQFASVLSRLGSYSPTDPVTNIPQAVAVFTRLFPDLSLSVSVIESALTAYLQ